MGLCIEKNSSIQIETQDKDGSHEDFHKLLSRRLALRHSCGRFAYQNPSQSLTFETYQRIKVEPALISRLQSAI